MSCLLCLSLPVNYWEFSAEKKQPMQELSDLLWLADLGFLVDITKHLNVLNTSLQGPEAVISQLYLKIKAFEAKLQLFKRHLLEAIPNTAHLLALQEIMTRFPQSNFSAQTRRYALHIYLWLKSSRQIFRNLQLSRGKVLCFPHLSPWTQMMFRTICSWSSLNCSVTLRAAIGTSNFLSPIFTDSWIRTSFARFEYLQRIC